LIWRSQISVGVEQDLKHLDVPALGRQVPRCVLELARTHETVKMQRRELFRAHC